MSIYLMQEPFLVHELSPLVFKRFSTTIHCSVMPQMSLTFINIFQILREADSNHRALVHNNVESRKLRIWLKFWKIDIYHACLRFTSF